MTRWVVGAVAIWLCQGLCSCGTELTTAGAAVRVGRTPPEGLRCSELGIVYGSGSGGGYTNAQEKLESAQNDLRNQAAARGGNFVIMDASAGDLSGISMSGRALNCVEGPVNATPVEGPSSAWPDAKAPPETAKAEQPAPSAAPPAQSTEQRLRALDDLHKKGLVTDAEYQERRKEIIDSI